MEKEQLIKHWKIVKVQLDQAAQFLQEPEQVTSEVKQLLVYREFLEHNELELALDELAEVAMNFGCKPGFWRRLKKPAIQMGLLEKAKEYEELFQEALAGKQ